jgi:hypothetical protein
MYTFSSPANTSIVGFSKSSQSTSMIQPQNFMPILEEWKSFYQIGYGIQPCKCHTGNIHMSWALITLMPLLIIIRKVWNLLFDLGLDLEGLGKSPSS